MKRSTQKKGNISGKRHGWFCAVALPRASCSGDLKHSNCDAAKKPLRTLWLCRFNGCNFTSLKVMSSSSPTRCSCWCNVKLLSRTQHQSALERIQVSMRQFDEDTIPLIWHLETGGQWLDPRYLIRQLPRERQGWRHTSQTCVGDGTRLGAQVSPLLCGTQIWKFILACCACDVAVTGLDLFSPERQVATWVYCLNSLDNRCKRLVLVLPTAARSGLRSRFVDDNADT